MLFECVRKEPTEHWAITIQESAKLMHSINQAAKRIWYDCFLKWYPKDISNYTPTHNEYHLKTLEDIASLSPEQVEMFIEDLRNWCELTRAVNELKKLGIKAEQQEWMIRQDTWKHEANIQVQANISNKL